MVPSIAYFMANRVLENETWNDKLKSIGSETPKKIMDKAKGYVVAMCRVMGIKLTEEEIRESAAEIMLRIMHKEI